MTKTDDYARRFEKVFDYIDIHLGEPLSVEALAGVANFSKFHFHRQFSLYAGLSVARYVQLMRLRRASYRLAFNPDIRIIDIALEMGFENPESFSRAFKSAFRQTPSQFRTEPKWEAWTARSQTSRPKRIPEMKVEIVEFEETPVAVFEHLGSPDTVNASAQVFIDWRKQSGLSPVDDSRTFGIAYADPNTTPPEEFRFDICGEVAQAVPVNPQGVVNKRIPGGRCAVVRLHGSHDRIDEAAYYLYRDWLPQSGEELRDFPLFFHYLNLIPMVEEHELVTDIYLPLK